MKANHNFQAVLVLKFNAVINTSKIQNESKSQRYCPSDSITNSCYQYIKDTK